MTMETFEITLKITIDNTQTAVTPAEWDWFELLDLAPNEEVEVIDQKEIINHG